jgi:hypothetical protein
MLRSPGVNRGNAEALGLVPTEQRGDRNRWEAREIASDGQGTEFRVRRFLDSARTAPGLPAVFRSRNRALMLMRARSRLGGYQTSLERAPRIGQGHAAGGQACRQPIKGVLAWQRRL